MYSPAAIDIAPPTSPATPAVNTGERVVVGGGDADHEARDGDDAVVGAEHGRAQPAGTVTLVLLHHVRGHGHARHATG